MKEIFVILALMSATPANAEEPAEKTPSELGPEPIVDSKELYCKNVFEGIDRASRHMAKGDMSWAAYQANLIIIAEMRECEFPEIIYLPAHYERNAFMCKFDVGPEPCNVEKWTPRLLN
tara:strand:- start:480 stop:836 length:357 start_codon:yes stop_codon:yes gene_type:complete